MGCRDRRLGDGDVLHDDSNPCIESVWCNTGSRQALVKCGEATHKSA
jgi:hypothetical protein